MEQFRTAKGLPAAKRMNETKSNQPALNLPVGLDQWINSPATESRTSVLEKLAHQKYTCGEKPNSKKLSCISEHNRKSSEIYYFDSFKSQLYFEIPVDSIQRSIVSLQ